MRKIIFILLAFASLTARAQSYDTTITVSASQLANLYNQPVTLLTPQQGYTNYVTSIVGYLQAGKPYSTTSIMIKYSGCTFYTANFSQILSMSGDTYIYNALNSIPDKCYQGAPIILYSNGDTGSGNGTLKIILTYIKIQN